MTSAKGENDFGNRRRSADDALGMKRYYDGATIVIGVCDGLLVLVVGVYGMVATYKYESG